MTLDALANRIRKAALGPTPRPFASLRSDWIGVNAVTQVAAVLGKFWCWKEWDGATELQRRFFLLFVAEAVQHE